MDDPEAIRDEILKYYIGLLGTPFDQRVDAKAELHQAIHSKVSVEAKAALTRNVTCEEVKKALWSINGDKAPGPDGYNSLFYQKNWDIVGPDLVAAVVYFFNHGYLLKEWNSTTISLIPKVSSPATVKDFRPISCCNVSYKCITKILANRLQLFLPCLIDQAQSAFIKGRSIVDNVLLMEELVRGYHRDDGIPRCAVKIDFMKAYDSVDWPFLFDVMDVMGFPRQYILWVSQCVTTARYSVIINGPSEGYFQGHRGLRQGDPLSPYLFLIVMEAFSALLHFRVEHSQFTYHPKCKELKLCHLAFADDLFIMCGATSQSFSLINSLLTDFYSFSGLRPNLSKSSIFFAGVDVNLKGALVNILPIPEAKLSIKYLGVPLIDSRLKAEDCRVLKDRILHRIQGWSSKSLSYGGRAS